MCEHLWFAICPPGGSRYKEMTPDSVLPVVLVAPEGGHRDVEGFGFISFCCSDMLHLIWFML